MRAGNGTRTRDPNLGKVVLYQLSYSRNDSRKPTGPVVPPAPLVVAHSRANLRRGLFHQSPILLAMPAAPRHGGEGNRTPDLLNAIQALSQLSYAPSSSTLPTSPRYRSPIKRRLPSGTTKYSRGYSECQRNRTGENLGGRYLAALSVTPFRKRTRCSRPLSVSAAIALLQIRSDAVLFSPPLIDADSNALIARGPTVT